MKDYQSVLNEIAQLREKKGQDYNSGITLEEYFPFGQVSYTQMLHIKVLRLRSLTTKEGKPNFEGIRDTLMDIVNYAIFNIQAIDNETVS